MDIKYKLYPHPVLWDKLDDYQNSRFDCSIDIEREIKKFTLNVRFEIDNKDIKNLIDNGYAEFVLHIESPATSYRLVKSTSKDFLKFALYDEHLLGRISLCPFIVAKQDIKAYTSDDLSQDYNGATFDLQKGTIIAIGSQFDFKVDKEKEDLSSVQSIFTIYKKETTEDMPMEIELCSNKIRIGLNIPDYENYNINVRNMPDVINAFVIFPALIYTFEQLKSGFDDFKEYRWFQAIERIFKKYSMEFNQETLESTTSLELSQKIMSMPISKALNRISLIDNVGEEN